MASAEDHLSGDGRCVCVCVRGTGEDVCERVCADVVRHALLRCTFWACGDVSLLSGEGLRRQGASRE